MSTITNHWVSSKVYMLWATVYVNFLTHPKKDPWYQLVSSMSFSTTVQIIQNFSWNSAGHLCFHHGFTSGGTFTSLCGLTLACYMGSVVVTSLSSGLPDPCKTWQTQRMVISPNCCWCTSDIILYSGIQSFRQTGRNLVHPGVVRIVQKIRTIHHSNKDYVV